MTKEEMELIKGTMEMVGDIAKLKGRVEQLEKENEWLRSFVVTADRSKP